MSPEQSKIDSVVIYQREPLEFGGFISDLWDIDILEITDLSIATISLKATTPILFFTKDLFIEAGLVTGYKFASYKIAYQYDYTKTKVEWNPSMQRYVSSNMDRKIAVRESENRSHSELFIYPNIDLNIHLFNPIALQLSVSYKYTTLSAGFMF